MWTRVYVRVVLVDSTPLVVSRQVLSVLPSVLSQMSDSNAYASVARHALEKMAPRAVSFEEQNAAIREAFADVLERQEKLSEAASVLAGIDLDSGVRQVGDEYKFRICVRTAMLYLEDDDSVGADAFIKKATFLFDATKEDGVTLQFRVCYARILDAKRKFLDAAVRYYVISKYDSVSAGDSGGSDANHDGATAMDATGADGSGGADSVPLKIDSDDIKVALMCAVSCTILAAAGPQRSRMLATLYKDERCKHLETFPILEKVFMDRILMQQDINAFSRTLKPHHLALTADGSTVLQRSMVEHNMLSCSKVYNNIGFGELGMLLGIDKTNAEFVAARMITEGRMAGSIDQLESMIYFNDIDTSSAGGGCGGTGASGTNGSGANGNKQAATECLQWDAMIQDVCNGVNKIIEEIAKKNLTAEIELS